MLRLQFFITILIFHTHLSCQYSLEHLGAHNESIGNMGSIVDNEFACAGNPSGIAFNEDSSISISVNHKLFVQIPTFHTSSIAFAFPSVKFPISCLISRTGSDAFNISSINLGCSKKINSIAFGMSCNLKQFVAEGYTSKHKIVLNAGCMYQPNKKLKIGSYITNFNQSSFLENEPLETIMSIGVKYKIVQYVQFLSEYEKNTHSKSSIKCGIEYKINQNVLLGIGINTTNNKIYSGLGISYEKMAIHLSYSYNYYLSSAFQLSLKIKFG